jgi:hypothetical protein
MFVRFNGVRPINLATQSLNASSEANQPSATADNRPAVAGHDFGRALTAHIFSVDGSPSTAKAESIQHRPFVTEPMQPGSDVSSNIATDLRNDELPLTQPEPVQSPAGRSAIDTPVYPDKETGKGAGANSAEIRQKVKGGPLQDNGPNSAAVPLAAFMPVPVVGPAMMTSLSQNRDISSPSAAPMLSDSEGVPNVTTPMPQPASDKGIVGEDGSVGKNADLDLPDTVSSLGPGAEQEITRSGLTTDPSWHPQRSQLADSPKPLRASPPPTNEGGLGSPPLTEKPADAQSQYSADGSQVVPDTSRLPAKTPVQPTSPPVGTRSIADIMVRAGSAESIRQTGFACLPSEVLDTSGRTHAPSAEGPTAGFLLPHTQPAAAVTTGNPYQRLDQISSAAAGPSILSAGTNRMTVGLHDPALGWVEIKTQLTAGQVAAALSTTSSQTHHDLAAQLPLLAQFLSDREVKVSSLAVDQQNPGGSESNPGSSRNQQEGDRSQTGDHAQSEVSAAVGVESGPSTMLDSHSTRYISVLA